LVASFTSQQAAPQAPRPSHPSPSPRQSQGKRALQLLQGSLSGRKVERRSPLLAGFHRAADGTLVGLGLCMLTLSGLTLHWQTQWGRNYEQLEASQALGQRMQESAAVLEQHHLGAVKRPGQLVPTNSENLIYLPSVQKSPQSQAAALLTSIQMAPIRSGY
jgi:uncharacterized iron-regulated membrane protein